MAERKRVWKRFYRELEWGKTEHYLEEMAAQGWFLKTAGMGLIFERGEPRRCRYVLYKQEDCWEGEPPQGWRRIYETRTDDWQFLGVMEGAPDAEEEALWQADEKCRRLYATERKTGILLMLAGAVISVLFFALLWENLSMVCVNAIPAILLAGLLMLLDGAVRTVSVLVWNQRAKRELAQGKTPLYQRYLPYRIHTAFSVILTVLLAAALIFSIRHPAQIPLFAIYILAWGGAWYLTSRARLAARDGRGQGISSALAVLLVVGAHMLLLFGSSQLEEEGKSRTSEQVLITPETLGIPGSGEELTLYESGKESVLASERYYSLTYGEKPELFNYRVYTACCGWLGEHFMKRLTAGDGWEELTSEGGFRAAVKKSEDYTALAVLRGNRVLSLTCSEELPPESAGRAAEAIAEL